MKCFLPILLLGSAIAAPTAIAQDIEVQERDANAYHQITYIKYKNGTIDRAKEITALFKEADEKADLIPVVDIWMMSGEWDHVAIFNFDEGISELKYTISPNNAKFRSALAELMGGMDKADALIAEFDSIIERSEKDIGFSR